MQPTIEGLPGAPGGLFGGIVVPSREVFLPVFVSADGGDGWRAARRELDAVANPMLGETTISVSTPDGVTRTIRGYRKVEASQVWGVDSWSADGWQFLPVVFEAASPWWRQADELALDPWQQSAVEGFFGAEFFPVRVGSGGVFGADRPIVNDGQVDAYPTYTITTSSVPVDVAVTVTHVESGRSWTVGIDGLDGSVTVDTGAGTVTGPDGDWWERLSAPFDLWPIPPGEQTVRVDVDGDEAGITVKQSGDTLHFRAVQ
jgi:hypothetical protein